MLACYKFLNDELRLGECMLSSTSSIGTLADT